MAPASVATGGAPPLSIEKALMAITGVHQVRSVSIK
jgi:hypothetical protein